MRLEGMGKRLAKSCESGYDSSIIMVWEKYGAQTKAQEVSSMEAFRWDICWWAGWLVCMELPSIALLICALLSLLAAGAGWMWRKPAEKDVV